LASWDFLPQKRRDATSGMSTRCGFDKNLIAAS